MIGINFQSAIIFLFVYNLYFYYFRLSKHAEKFKITF